MVSALCLAGLSSSVEAQWRVSPSGILDWQDVPFQPVGLAIDGDANAIQQAKTAGVADVLVDVALASNTVSTTVQELEKGGFRYLLRAGNRPPMATGFTVEPQSYRVPSITTPRPFAFSLPGATSAVCILASRRDSSIAQVERLPVTGGLLSFTTKSGIGSGEYVLLIYPEQESSDLPDLWDGLDAYRDQVLQRIQSWPQRTGLRGIVNPLGALPRLPEGNSRVMPNSPVFRMELAAYLERRYRNVESATRAWGIGGGFVQQEQIPGTEKFRPLTSFADIARLVPLWSGNRGVSRMFDPATNQLLQVDNNRSAAWTDINEVLTSTARNRISRVVAAIRTAAGVPVLQDWTGWSIQTEGGANGLDGLGFRTTGSKPSELLLTSARASSTILRWSRPGWLVGTDIACPPDAELADLRLMADDLIGVGARGLYFSARTEAARKAVAELSQSLAAQTWGRNRVEALFFPENANEPAVAQRLPGGRWWLPSPASGNRIDLGSNFFAYRLVSGGQNKVALWTTRPGRVKLMFSNPKDIVVESLDGTDTDPRRSRNTVEVTIGQLPILISGTEEVPVPEPALQETLAGFEALLRYNDSLKRDIIEESTMFTEYAKGMERNPGGNFALMRQMYNRMILKVTDITWFEAEGARENTMSDVVQIGGCSADYALVLNARLPLDTGYTATYSLPIRNGEDMEVWIAARIPADRRKDVVLSVGSQFFTITEPPVSPYGQGFAWYRLGKTKNSPGLVRAVLQVVNPFGAEFAFDTIVLAPSFKPQGTRIPEPFEFLPKPPQ